MTDKPGGESVEKIRESEYGGSPNNFHISRRGNTISVELAYPAISENGVKFVEFDQESVRASDGIRIHYDYDRDGYSIEQPQRLSWDADDPICDPLWKEVAFIPAWGSNIDDKEETEKS